MAQLPPPALLLGRRQGGEHRPGERGASPRASHDQRPDPSPRGRPRREAVHPPGAKPRAHRVRPRRVPLRRRDLHAGARVRRHAQGPGERQAVAPRRRRRGRASPVAGAAVSGTRVPARPTRPGHLPGGQVRAGVPRRARAAQRGRRDSRRPRRVRYPGARVQPPAGRVRNHVLRRPEAGGQAPAQVSPFARCGPVSPSRRAFDGSAHARALVRYPGHPAALRRGAGRQRDREGVRRRRPGRVRGAGGDRGRDPSPLSGARRRPRGGGSASSSTPSRWSARSSTPRWSPSARWRARTSLRRRVRPRRRRSGPHGGGRQAPKHQAPD